MCRSSLTTRNVLAGLRCCRSQRLIKATVTVAPLVLYPNGQWARILRRVLKKRFQYRRTNYLTASVGTKICKQHKLLYCSRMCDVSRRLQCSHDRRRKNTEVLFAQRKEIDCNFKNFSSAYISASVWNNNKLSFFR